MKMTRRICWINVMNCMWLLAIATASAFCSPQTGRWLNRDPSGEAAGPNAFAFLGNEGVNNVDALGLLQASVQLITYTGHGSAEKNGEASQYVVVDDAITGQVPLRVSDEKSAASITASLDDSFRAEIFSWTSFAATQE